MATYVFTLTDEEDEALNEQARAAKRGPDEVLKGIIRARLFRYTDPKAYLAIQAEAIKDALASHLQ